MSISTHREIDFDLRAIDRKYQHSYTPSNEMTMLCLTASLRSGAFERRLSGHMPGQCSTFSLDFQRHSLAVLAVHCRRHS